MMKNSFLDFHLQEIQKSYFKELLEKIKREAKTNVILPAQDKWFRALEYFTPDETKLIILGQDPYYLKNQADGLAFSSNFSQTPKSLQNLMLEIKKDYPSAIFETNKLVSWARQGVLLLNTILTVNENRPLSHKNFGWEIYTSNLIKFIYRQNRKFILLLLGNEALNFYKEYLQEINLEKIIFRSHPSPLSYARGSKPLKNSSLFKEINSLLPENQQIDFSIRKDKKC
ncbi:uracil-DNA glycosylase [Mycoplasmopsis columbina]|nr:uracil-DNA glycosylase [Mycoplasmopsis columbina]